MVAVPTMLYLSRNSLQNSTSTRQPWLCPTSVQVCPGRRIPFSRSLFSAARACWVISPRPRCVSVLVQYHPSSLAQQLPHVVSSSEVQQLPHTVNSSGDWGEASTGVSPRCSNCACNDCSQPWKQFLAPWKPKKVITNGGALTTLAASVAFTSGSVSITADFFSPPHPCINRHMSMSIWAMRDRR